MAVSIGLTVLAFVQRHEANEDKRFAQAQALTAAASESLDSDPLLSTQLARAAVELSHTLEAEAVLHRTLAQHDHRTLLQGHGSAVGSAAFSPNGERVVTASQDATARIWPCGIACVQLTNSELVESAEALAGDLDHDDSARYLPE